MKKVPFLILLLIGFSLVSKAQEKMVTSAHIAEQEKDYEKAKLDIDEALNDPSTKESAKAWAIKGSIYTDLQQDPKNRDSNFYRQIADAYIKVISLKPDYQKETINKALIACAYSYFNDAVIAYNSRKYAEANDLATQTIKIHDIDNGKRFAGIKTFDTVAAQAKFVAANSAYYNNNYDVAVPMFQELIKDHIMVKPSVYLNLADIYNKQNKADEAAAIIEQGRKEYPEDPSIRNEELNYYIKTGRQSELMNKLEEATQKEPNNPELFFDLGTGYVGMAQPKDAAKPANYSELMNKAEAAYQKSVTLAPDNATYNYNFGAFYFNQAADMSKTMSDLPADDQKKYEELKTKRDNLINKSLPYIEKSYTLLDTKASSLTPEEKQTYSNSLTALISIYSMQSKMDKANELKKKLQSLH